MPSVASVCKTSNSMESAVESVNLFPTTIFGLSSKNISSLSRQYLVSSRRKMSCACKLFVLHCCLFGAKYTTLTDIGYGIKVPSLKIDDLLMLGVTVE